MIMLKLYIFALALSFACSFVLAIDNQHPFITGAIPPKTVKKRYSVAIVGAGISGSVAAFQLRELNHAFSSFAVTIFEREANVGGRIKSVPVPKNPRNAVEAGSAHIYTEDWCLLQGIKNTGLEFDPRRTYERPRSLGIWNGESIGRTSSCDSRGFYWRELWRYGLSPWRYHRSARKVSNSWRSFASTRLIDNLTSELEQLDLESLVSEPAAQYFREQELNNQYVPDNVEPCTRARFFQNIQEVHGFAALMAAQKSRLGSVRGGNSDLIERLVKLSDSHLYLNTSVTKIEPGLDTRYRVSYTTRSPAGTRDDGEQGFDIVILATPLQYSAIDLGSLHQASLAKAVPYTRSHVTHILSPQPLSYPFLNVSVSEGTTDDILVTANASQRLNLSRITRSPFCWIDRDDCHRGQMCDQMVCENMFRVASQTQLEDEDLVALIGGHFEKGVPLTNQGISWTHRQAWPHAFPRRQFNTTLLEEIQIAPNLFYLSGAEEVVSSMEMGCRMGQNVARRLYEGL